MKINPKRFFKNHLFSFIISTAFMAAICAVAFVFDVRGGIFSAVIFSLYLVYVIVYFYFGSGDAKNLLAGKSLSSQTFNFIAEMDLPVLLCDGGGAVSWYNRALAELYPDSKIQIGESCVSIGDGDVSTEKFIKHKTEGDGTYILRRGGRHYRVHPYEIETMRKNFYLVAWYDVTDYENLYAEHQNSNVLVAYAVVDNISEVSQGLQDKYRQVSLDIANILAEWVASMKGVIKEYERDKYLILFEERYVKAQVESKFEILDRVYELTDTDENLPLTISLGVARIDGALSEKEEAAKISLQIALQRGGAQAVVKTKTETDYFGGKTKTVQKLTKIKSRMAATQLVSLINKSRNVLIMSHANPDFDAIASGVGVARLALHLGKDVNIITDFSNYSFNICASMLSVIKDYDNMFVDKVYGQELLTPYTLLVITDVNNERIFESPEIYKNAELVAVIDHHRQTQEFEKKHEISYIEPTASSASELISEMLELVLPPNTLYKEEAELLLAGILLDTQNFARSVGIRTFSAAVYLRGEGANTGKAQSLFKYRLGEFKKLAEFERNIFIFRKIFAISQYELDNTSENRVTAAQAAERMLQIESIRASFTLATVEEGIHVSARSDGSVNVSLILEKFKGGGHFDSAGASLAGFSMKQALLTLREAIIEYCETK